MPLLDVSLTLHDGLPGWPGDPQFHRELASAIERGDAANVSRLEMSAHSGTHVDAPIHFAPGGSGADRLPLDVLVGPCLVVEADPPGLELGPGDLPGAPQRVLFKTRNSRHWATGDLSFDRDFTAVGVELARELVTRGVRLIGVDYLSVETFHTHDHPVHRLLLEAGVVIVEGLDLSGAAAGSYELWCLPLRIEGSDGAPARVVLVS